MRMVGDRVEHNWRMPNIRGKRAVRHVVFDTNYWKSFVASRLLTSRGDRGNLSLWGRETVRHMLFAEHLTAEYRVKTEGRGRKVDEWKMRPEAHDNHWFDGVVGAAPCGPYGVRFAQATRRLRRGRISRSPRLCAAASSRGRTPCRRASPRSRR